MNRGGAAFDQSSLWSLLHNMRTTHTLLPLSSNSNSSSSSSSSLALQTSNFQSMTQNWDESREFPQESWKQLLMSDLGEEDKQNLTSYQTKKMENWEDQVIYPSVKGEFQINPYSYQQTIEDIQAPKCLWSQIIPNSSPRPCITRSFNSNMLDFTNSKPETRIRNVSQDCNSTSTDSPYKKARVQAPQVQSTPKVRKEKLGERITTLHQLASPFGKTDTASVLLEAIGYIKFLQNQIEALSSPYLAADTNNMVKQQVQGEKSCKFPEGPGQLLNDNNIKKTTGPSAQDLTAQDKPKKDLRSRGLCLVPVSFTMHVGIENGSDYWAPAFYGGF